jgi:hypothetical protein
MARAAAADAFNLAEFEMRARFKQFPEMTAADLASYWISQAQIHMADFTFGQGKVGRIGSIHPATLVPKIPYLPCVSGP